MSKASEYILQKIAEDREYTYRGEIVRSVPFVGAGVAGGAVAEWAKTHVPVKAVGRKAVLGAAAAIGGYGVSNAVVGGKFDNNTIPVAIGLGTGAIGNGVYEAVNMKQYVKKHPLILPKNVPVNNYHKGIAGATSALLGGLASVAVMKGIKKDERES